jgi:hypothetical protein
MVARPLGEFLKPGGVVVRCCGDKSVDAMDDLGFELAERRGKRDVIEPPGRN